MTVQFWGFLISYWAILVGFGLQTGTNFVHCLMPQNNLLSTAYMTDLFGQNRKMVVSIAWFFSIKSFLMQVSLEAVAYTGAHIFPLRGNKSHWRPACNQIGKKYHHYNNLTATVASELHNNLTETWTIRQTPYVMHLAPIQSILLQIIRIYTI